MWDTRKRFEDYMVVDLRLNSNIIEYHPSPVAFRVIRLHENSREPLIKLFYKENVTQKLKWIAEKMKNPAKVSYMPKSDQVIFGLVTMEIKNFPITSFARRFKMERILDRDIMFMHMFIRSGSDLQIIDHSFIGLTSPLKGRLTIGSVDEKAREIIRDEEIVLPIELQGAANN